MNSLPAIGRTSPVIGLGRIVGGEQQQDLRLDRIGVLELVDEDARELRLQVACARRVVRDQIARPGQQVGEVERAGRGLSCLVAVGRSRQLLLQQCGEIGVGVLPELLQVGEQLVARGEHVGPRRGPAVLVPLPFRGREKPRSRTRSTSLASQPSRSASPNDCSSRICRLRRRTASVSMKKLSRGDDGASVRSANAMQRRDQRARSRRRDRTAGGSTGAGSRATPPASRPALRSRSTGPSALAAERRRARPAQRPPHPFRRILAARPAARRAKARVYRRVACSSVSTDEQRIDPRFDGPFTQQLGAEAMDGVDVRFFERLERRLRARRRTAARPRRARVPLQLLAQPQLQLPRGLLGERDGDDLSILRAAGREHPQDPAHQLGRLAGAGGRFDDQRVVEIVARSRARASRPSTSRVIACSSAPRDRRDDPWLCAGRAPLHAVRRPDGSRTTCRPAPQEPPARKPLLDRTIDDRQHLEPLPARVVVHLDRLRGEAAGGGGSSTAAPGRPACRVPLRRRRCRAPAGASRHRRRSARASSGCAPSCGR